MSPIVCRGGRLMSKTEHAEIPFYGSILSLVSHNNASAKGTHVARIAAHFSCLFPCSRTVLKADAVAFLQIGFYIIKFFLFFYNW